MGISIDQIISIMVNFFNYVSRFCICLITFLSFLSLRIERSTADIAPVVQYPAVCSVSQVWPVSRGARTVLICECRADDTYRSVFKLWFAGSRFFLAHKDASNKQARVCFCFRTISFVCYILLKFRCITIFFWPKTIHACSWRPVHNPQRDQTTA